MTQNIRNLALVGHAGSGKTSLTEALLHHAGMINQPGTLERGSTVSDFTPQERELQHSLEVSLCHIDHSKIHINLLDTPGYPDFVGRSICALPAADAAAVVISAANGIEPVTEKMMQIAAERDLCRMIVINKIDADCDLEQLLEQIQQKFGAVCLPLNLPSADGQNVVDCFFTHGDTPTAFLVGGRYAYRHSRSSGRGG